MRKNSEKIRIHFCGNNADDVTGSCVYVETPNRKILLELGMFQTVGSKLEAWKENTKKFDFKAKDIDYLFVAHSHSDHCGLVPLLFNRGGRADVIVPNGSTPLLSILWRDSAHIIEADAEELTKKRGKQYIPYYDNNDVGCALQHVSEYPQNEIVVLDDYVSFRFVSSGHIVSGCQLELWITEGNITKKILYTSDMGNSHIQKAYVEPLSRVERADVVISESTYANEHRIANKKMRDADLAKLKSVVEQTCIDDKSRILIPVFALDRLQNIMTVIYQTFSRDGNFKIPVLIDTPMGQNVCRAYSEILSGDDKELWEQVQSWDNFVYVSDYIESKSWRDDKGPCIVLASSGFLIAGRSIAWAASLLPRSTDRIVTVGYAPPGSLAYDIKNEIHKTISITGKRYANRCQVTNLGSFTSHIQRDELLDYLSSINCQRIYLVHGEMDGKLSFAKELQDEISSKDRTSRVICTNRGMEATL